MAATFDEILLDPSLFRRGAGESYPVTGQLEWANSQPRNAQTGVRKTSVGRLDAVESLTIDVALLNDTERRYFIRFLRGGQGSAVGFRAYLPHDHTATLETIGTGDGVKTEFKLTVTYARPGETTHADVRRIYKPVVQVAKEKSSFQLLQSDGATARVVGGAPNYFDSALKIYFNGVEQTSGWTVDCKTGKVYFATPPSVGVIVAWSGVFDVPLAFEGNSFVQQYDVSSGAQYSMRELLGPELGLS